ncbi:YsnF/AvaK domain-containing protein [Rubrivirga sp.]|uniref:YsnF/AvaK domain-containing protein n=1 Tax=Rubrivirga sp. TaxID=1885344 RepID=UPI003C76EC4A
MSDVRVIHDQAGRPGVVESESDERVRVRLPHGSVLDLPVDMVSRDPEGGFKAAVSFSDLNAGATQVLREVEETLDVSTRTVERGRVVARAITDSRDHPVDAAGWRETVEVDRVPINRVVDAVEDVRVEDGVTIVPVYEEVLVVHKQLMLREELHLSTRREEVPGPASVTLRRQRVEVERLPPSDAGLSAG